MAKNLYTLEDLQKDLPSLTGADDPRYEDIKQRAFEDAKQRNSGLTLQTFTKVFNPNDQYASIEKYKEINKQRLLSKYNIADERQLDDILVAKDAYDTFREVYGEDSEKNFKAFSLTFSPIVDERRIKDVKYFVPRAFNNKEIAETLGYDTEQSQAGERAVYAANLAANDKERQEIGSLALFNYFKNKTGRDDFDLDIRVDPYTELEMYTNPVTKEREFINAPGFSTADLYEYRTIGRRVMADMLGYIIGGRVGTAVKLGKFIGRVAGVGFGTSYENARIVADKNSEYGAGFGKDEATQKKIWKQEFDKAQQDGTIPYIDGPSAVITGVVEAMFPIWRAAKYLYQTGSMPPEVVKGFEKLVKRAKPDSKKEDVIKVIKDAKDIAHTDSLKHSLRLSVAEASNDRLLLGIQDDMERHAVGKKGVETIKKFEDIREDRADAIVDIIKYYASPFSGRNFSKQEFGDGIKKLFLTRKNQDVQALTKELENSGTNLVNKEIFLPSGNIKKIGEDISTIISDLKRAKYGKVSKNYDNLMKLYGDDVIDMTRYFDKLKTVYKTASDDLGKNIDEIKKDLNLPVLKEMLDQDYTLRQWHETLKGVRLKKRSAETSPRGKILLKEIEDEMMDMMETQFANSSFLRQFNIAEYVAQRYFKQYDKNLIKEFKFENNKITVAGEDVLKQILKNENGSSKNVIDDLTEFHNFVKNVPGLKAKVSNLIMADLALKSGSKELADLIAKTGTKNLKTNDYALLEKGFGKYMDNYPTAAKLFLGVKDPIGAKNKVKLEIRNLVNRNNEISKYASRLQDKFGLPDNFTPEDLFRKTWNPKQPSQTEELFNLIKNDPDALQSYRATILDDFSKNIFDNKFQFDEVGFLSWYGNNKELFNIAFPKVGKFATDETKKIANAYEKLYNFTKYTISPSRLKNMTDEIIPPDIEAFIRVRVAPPLSKQGVFLTKMLRRFSQLHDQRLEQILTSPDLIEEYTKFRTMNKTTEKGFIEADKIFENLFGASAREIIRQFNDAATDINEDLYEPKDLGQPGGYIKGEGFIKEESPREKELKNQSNLSQAPINVAQMDMPRAQTTNVASAPVNKPQGIAALSPGQGSGTTAPGSNAQTIAKMDQIGLPLFTG